MDSGVSISGLALDSSQNNRSPRLLVSMARVRGFTLIELMIVIVVIAVLSTIALPMYGDYLKRSRARAASADLVALSLNFANAYQRTLAYPTSAADVSSAKAGWAPTQSDFFDYTTDDLTASTYTLKASGKSGTKSSGCVITLKHDNTRTISGGANNGCGGISSW